MTVQRCDWALGNDLELEYHDHEWGVPEHRERELFELLILESMQAGLSWSLILQKRPFLRDAFDAFNYETIAGYSEAKVDSLLSNPTIIRNHLKIKAAVTNAQAFIRVQNEAGSFDQYLWSFVDNKPVRGNWMSVEEVPSTSPLSETISQDFRKRGFKFVGPTTVYSFLQATGVLNDHINSCFRFTEVNASASNPKFAN
ncbi:DNA-3-methyladenine glycosylase I [Bombiscardovia coagulans]|uniref:DNA-3-methyladenine glycosylase I n=1 Tax=Bombiscardovia coagulans TaxID=686666 RepID=A0A261ET04_9BIFI|nr:DNA-3-methyladenine glycosylase I [Bombiscardovia coagulans]OZG49990.1 DNA-3-methyladenine glycosylase I [Bombiscardovia coagulans]